MVHTVHLQKTQEYGRYMGGGDKGGRMYVEMTTGQVAKNYS
jgi:hypothetical protein